MSMDGDWGSQWDRYAPRGEERANLDALRKRFGVRTMPAPTLHMPGMHMPSLHMPVGRAARRDGEAETADYSLEAIALASREPKDHTKLKRTVAVGLAGVMALTMTMAGARAWQRHTITVLQRSCVADETMQDQAIRDLDASIAKARPSGGLPASAVADPKTIDALNARLSRHVTRTVAPCSSEDSGVLRSGMDALTARAGKARDQRKNINVAVRAVVASRAAKSLADARASLASALDGAQGTLDSSKGRVADENTRTVLSGVLAAARRVAGDKSVRDPGRLDAARRTLDAPVRAVNDSVARKAADDRAKADAAAAQRNQPAQPAQPAQPVQPRPSQRQPAGGGSGASRGGSAGGGQGGGWYVPPAGGDDALPNHL